MKMIGKLSKYGKRERQKANRERRDEYAIVAMALCWCLNEGLDDSDKLIQRSWLLDGVKRQLKFVANENKPIGIGVAVSRVIQYLRRNSFINLTVVSGLSELGSRDAGILLKSILDKEAP